MTQRTESTVAVIARQVYWRAEAAQVVVDEWRRSGESQRRFAQRHGVKLERLRRWAARLRSGIRPWPAQGRAAFQFFPVHVVADRAGGTAQLETPGAVIEIALAAGRVVRVAPGFAAEDLTRVLAVLGAQSEQ